MDAEAIRELFAEVLPVRVKRLFGGLGVYDDELIFALVFQGEVYLRTDAETQGRFEAAGSRPFTYEARSRERSLGYWTLPDEALDDPEVLRAWTALARGAARRKAAGSSGRVRRRGSSPPARLR